VQQPIEGDTIVNFGLPANLDGMDGLIVLVVVVVVLFGSRQIPKLARSLGSAQKEFKKGLDEGASETSETSDSSEAGKSSPAVTPAIPPAAVNPPAQTTVTVETNGDGSSGSSS
jgi:sec-independent protein translocase protein TatA